MVYPPIPLYLTEALGATPVLVGVIEGIAESLASLLKVFSGYVSDRFLAPPTKPCAKVETNVACTLFGWWGIVKEKHSMSKTPIKAVIFDMGGTLEDLIITDEGILRCGELMLEFLAKHGVHTGLTPAKLMEGVMAGHRAYGKWSSETLLEAPPHEMWARWQVGGFSIDPDLLRVIANDLTVIWELNYYNRVMRPEAPAMLEALKTRGYKLGVLSNTACLTQMFDSIKDYGIDRYFDYITLSSLMGMRKPNPLVFTVTARNMGVEPSQCIYVGDTIYNDVLGPRRAGYAKTIRIGSHLTMHSDAADGLGENAEDADFVIGGLLEIPGILDGLAG
ncbi:MAG: HAD-IA family hydrolase [Lachnospiraceae bacterium]|jgi:putative hydrolase of the HAD superfamily|nr:HAD-IA family hydrolase [Lachnospiraceae bacterium]